MLLAKQTFLQALKYTKTIYFAFKIVGLVQVVCGAVNL